MKKENDKPFFYQRGRCQFQGSSEKDRNMIRLEIILHWIWKIVLAIIAFFGVICQLYF